MDLEPQPRHVSKVRLFRDNGTRRSGRCWPRRRPTASRWRRIRSRCCTRAGPSASCWRRRCPQEGGSGPAGFVTFSSELAPLMLVNDDRSLFSVVLKDPRDANDEFVSSEQGVVTLRPVKADGPARRCVGQRSRSAAATGRSPATPRPKRRDARTDDGDHRGRHWARAHRHRLRPVRRCRLATIAAEP